MRQLVGAATYATAKAIARGAHFVAQSSGRTMCSECNQWGVWDWEFWYYQCYEPPPPNCGQGD